MKKIYTTLVAVLAIVQFSFGQWTYPSGTISTTNKVGIGGSASSTSQLQVTGDATITGSSPAGGTFLTLDDQATAGRTGVRLRFQSNGIAHWNLGIPANMDAFSINGWNGTNAGAEFFRINNIGNIGIGTPTPGANLDVNTNAIIGTGGNKLNTALTLIKNGDNFGTDYPVLLLKHSGNGVNWYPNPASDFGVLQISGFNPAFANKAINSNNNFYVYTNGAVGINTDKINSEYKLMVNGKVRATEIKVETGWADYVFDADYKVRTLAEVEQFINLNHHLPEVPSAAEVAKNGVNLGETSSLLLKKIEELTLYIIEKNKQVNEQNTQLKNQQTQIDELKAQMAKLLK